MTLWAQRTEGGNMIDVQITSGPVVVRVTEPPSVLRHFWGQLGELLKEAEQAQSARDETVAL